jgi:hypothetical protein
MVYDDADFLPIWKKYWLDRLPGASLLVLVHGGGEEMMDLAEGTTRIPLARPDPYPDMEVDRWRMLGHVASGLTYMNDVVVYNDVDEILVADPDTGLDVVDLLQKTTAPVNTPAGIEIIHRSDLEPTPLDPNLPVLQQRHHVRASNFYSKPCILRAPIRWGRGGHISDYDGIDFVEGLYNVHLRFMDDTLFLDRAVRRRQTTATNLDINAAERRKWRVSDDAAEALLAQHRAYPIAPATRDAPPMRSVHRPIIKRGRMVEHDGIAIRQFPFREESTLVVLPERFRSLV